jgi:hypothetical protein
MATITNVILTDDLNGREAEGTVRFALDGQAYEIDLDGSNSTAIRSTLKRYVDAGRRVGQQTRGRRTTRARAARGAPPATFRPATTPTGDGELTADDRQAVRAWARTQGIPVSERGRIKADTIAGWRAATAPAATAGQP